MSRSTSIDFAVGMDHVDGCACATANKAPQQSIVYIRACRYHETLLVLACVRLSLPICYINIIGCLAAPRAKTGTAACVFTSSNVTAVTAHLLSLPSP